MTIDREYIAELCKKIGTGEKMFYNLVGSLGGGNHFIEIGESANDGSHYLTIHSGSRNFGLKVCNYHAKKNRCFLINIYASCYVRSLAIL